MNIFKPRESSFDTNYLNRISANIEYIRSTESTIIKVYNDKQKFDWDLYIILYCQESKIDIIPEVKKIKYNNDETSIEFYMKNLCSLKCFLMTEHISKSHLLINELVSFIRYLKTIKIQTNNLSIDTLFIDKENFKFYLLDTINITFGDYLDTGIQMLNISIEDSAVNKELKSYFRKQLGITNNKMLFENVLSDIIDSYNT